MSELSDHLVRSKKFDVVSSFHAEGARTYSRKCFPMCGERNMVETREHFLAHIGNKHVHCRLEISAFSL